jgi:ribonuclease D
LGTQNLIDGPQALDGVVDVLSGAPLVAIDTEFVRESTYYPQLCLVQVAADDYAACIDFLAIEDPAPLFACLTRPGCTWLVHSATQDLEVLWLHTRERPDALIDTQIAAALLGHTAQIGLQELLSEILGVDIGKGFTRTDWSVRPLPDGALAYAVDDVRHLLPLWRLLEARLTERGRLDWVVEDSRRLLQTSDGGGLQGVWARLKGMQSLGPGGTDTQAAALALLRWRETTAQKLDRPRRWIISDDLLVRIAQLRPSTVSELAAIPDMPKRLAARSGQDIVAAVAARDDPALAAELQLIATAERPDRDALKALQQAVRQRAAELGIQAEVLASRRDLAALLTGNAPPHLRSGWRAEQLPALAAAAAESRAEPD